MKLSQQILSLVGENKINRQLLQSVTYKSNNKITLLDGGIED